MTEKPSSDLLTRAQAATGAARKREGGEAFVFGIRDEVAELLTGSPFNVDSYLQNAYRVLQQSKDLRLAAQQSGAAVLGGIMLGATLQLPIGGPLGQFYLTPRKQGQGNNQVYTCVPMIGYRGFFELGYRTGRVGKYDYKIVREGDHFLEYSNAEVGNWYEWRGMPDGAHDRPLTHVVAIAKMLNGEVAFSAMSRAQIDKRKPSYTTNTPWEGKHSEAMYVKTPHRELAKYQQLSVSMANAVTFDETIAEFNKATGAIQHGDEGTIPAEQPADEHTGEIPPDEGEIVVPAEEPAEHAPESPNATPEPQAGADGSEPSEAEWAEIRAEQMREREAGR